MGDQYLICMCLRHEQFSKKITFMDYFQSCIGLHLGLTAVTFSVCVDISMLEGTNYLRTGIISLLIAAC